MSKANVGSGNVWGGGLILTLLLSLVLASNANAELILSATGPELEPGYKYENVFSFTLDAEGDPVTSVTVSPENSGIGIAAQLMSGSEGTWRGVELTFPDTFSAGFVTSYIKIELPDPGYLATLKVDGESVDVGAGSLSSVNSPSSAYITGDALENFTTLSFIFDKFLSDIDGAGLWTVSFYSAVQDIPESEGSTPEPATMLIFGVGMAGAGIAAMRRRGKRVSK